MIVLKQTKLDTLSDLRQALQTAIELEHATIPPYLTANFTLFGTGNDQIAALIGSVIGEEMLHLSIACNVLNAVGGSPVLDKPSFVPRYPGPLPGAIDAGLIVPLEKFSKTLIHKVFMGIEEPESPIPVHASLAAASTMTIGMFYTRIMGLISTLEAAARAAGTTIFTGDPGRQVTYEAFYPPSLLFPITDQASALRGIGIIIDQGEGTPTDPFVVAGDDNHVHELAHYYRFEEVYQGQTIVANPAGGYAFGEPAIPFSPEKIPNMWPNPKMDDYPRDSQAYVNSRLFNQNYTALLACLHQTFTGQPGQIKAAMGIMFSLRLYALKLLAIPDPVHPGYVAGPSFEYFID